MTIGPAPEWQEVSDFSALAPAPVVSVLVLAYNQSGFLRETVDSILAQRFSRPFEVIISDDHSPDDTLEVAVQYQRNHPHLIRVLTAPQNVGIQRNLARIMSAARAPLIAFCEGDDYWTDALKLERQVALLDARDEVTLCYHGAAVFDQRKQEFVAPVPTPTVATDFELNEVILGGGGMMPTASVVVRARALPPPTSWFVEGPAGDYPIALWAASRGTCHAMPERMSVYRVATGVSWTDQVAGSGTRDWSHACSAIQLLERFPEASGRNDAWPAVRRMVRRYLRDFAAEYGSDMLKSMPAYGDLATRLKLRDRLFLMACDRPTSIRMKATWFVMSQWRRLGRQA